MADLFDRLNGEPERVNLPDSELYFFSSVFSHQLAAEYFSALQHSVQWREEEVSVWGKRYKQPRLVAWFGDPGATYTYSGSTLQPMPWTDRLRQLKHAVESLSTSSFNSVLLNYYRDKNDRMGWHSDDEPSLGENPTIASLSLGATRTFQFKHKLRRELKTVSIELRSGSLIVMSGPTQRFWLHSIKRESKDVGPRINLTFRRIRS